MSQKYDLGLVGLGVMGRNLLLNLADHGISVLGHDADAAKVSALRKEGAGKPIGAAESLAEFVKDLKSPHTVLFLVPAGAPVDTAVAAILPYLSPGDRLIDGGNSHFKDTERREKALAARGLFFIGMGISGGEEGARRGPSLMPGGDRESFEAIRPWLEAIAARADGVPCVGFVGPSSAGHYVKMVHNAIEYGWMQLLSEAVHLLRRGQGLSWKEIGNHLKEWNGAELNAFLVEITADICAKTDEETGRPLVELVSDVARQKGTGKWATEEARNLQVPIPTIEAAVTWRDLSRWKAERDTLSKGVSAMKGQVSPDDVRRALYASMVITLSQGLHLLRVASQNYAYLLDLEKVALLWRAGCILRAGLLKEVAAAYHEEPKLPHLLMDGALGARLKHCETSLRTVAKASLDLRLASPALLASVAYWDAMRDTDLPVSVVQAQRDYFGAHTYERRDKPGSFHSDWKTK